MPARFEDRFVDVVHEPAVAENHSLAKTVSTLLVPGPSTMNASFLAQGFLDTSPRRGKTDVRHGNMRNRGLDWLGFGNHVSLPCFVRQISSASQPGPSSNPCARFTRPINEAGLRAWMHFLAPSESPPGTFHGFTKFDELGGRAGRTNLTLFYESVIGLMTNPLAKNSWSDAVTRSRSFDACDRSKPMARPGSREQSRDQPRWMEGDRRPTRTGQQKGADGQAREGRFERGSEPLLGLEPRTYALRKRRSTN